MKWWPPNLKKPETLSIPRPLWSSELPRRILFKTLPTSRSTEWEYLWEGGGLGRCWETTFLNNHSRCFWPSGKFGNHWNNIWQSLRKWSRSLKCTCCYWALWPPPPDPTCPLSAPVVPFSMPPPHALTAFSSCLPLSHINVTSSRLPSLNFPTLNEVCLLWALQYILSCIILRHFLSVSLISLN